MDSVFEQQRKLHEEIEKLQDAAVQQREKMIQEHRVKAMLDSCQSKAASLSFMYSDTEKTRAEELEAINGVTDLQEFYSRLKSIKDYHRRIPFDSLESLELNSLIGPFTQREQDEMDALFSGEECYGRYLDLHEIYEIFINLKGIKRVDYVKFLGELDAFDQIPQEYKSGDYSKYLDKLFIYLEDFTKRAKPLVDFSSIIANASHQFDQRWISGKIPGWQINEYQESVFCLACKRNFSNQSVYEFHLKGKKHLKASEALLREKVNPNVDLEDLVKEAKEAGQSKKKEMAKKEFLIAKIIESLGELREETRSNVERKQSRTLEEREEDLLADDALEIEEEEEEEEEEDGKRIFNPLKLPLDWDGKPIPYWLWKLHGLGEEFPCEICGNYVYMGKRAFDRHFQEWRHAHGMKCLGIPNMKQFAGITSINDVIGLWDKLKMQFRSETFRPEVMEEIEDGQGNVYTRKIYEDLKRQGLI